MHFLREPLLLNASSKRTCNKHCCFAADLFNERSTFDQIQSWGECAHELADASNKLLGRKTCPIAWMACFIDAEGVVLLVCAKSDMQVGNMRSALDTAIAPLPKEQKEKLLETLRPLDELDAHRVRAWKTLASLRPKCGRERSAGSCDGPVYEFPAQRAMAMAALSSDSENEDCHAQQLTDVIQLALTDGSPQPEVSILDPMSVWVHRAKTEATVVIVNIGQRPHDLVYIHCHREPRRALLLRHMVQEDYTAPRVHHVIAVAVKLAAGGSFPGPSGAHGRKREFVKRCTDVLVSLDPAAETDLQRLGPVEAAEVRRLLGGTEAPYEGCLNPECLDEETEWVTKTINMAGEPASNISRCVQCGLPKSYGRTWRSLADILKLMAPGRNDDVREPPWKKRRDA